MSIIHYLLYLHSLVTQDELCILQKTWQDLADRTNGRGIDKETFLQYFPVTGLLGERFFVQFDQKSNGVIDFDEFITGLSVSCRGTVDEKIHFLFNMYDVGKTGSVSKIEMSTLLNHVPKYLLLESMSRGLSADFTHVESEFDSDIVSGHHTAGADELDEVDQYTNHDFVEKAFEECDLNHEGRLSYEEFKMWVQRTPGTLEYLESILPFSGHKDHHTHHTRLETLPLISMNPPLFSCC
jgi:Ca2+-binding EF-hand superfamily protein